MIGPACYQQAEPPSLRSGTAVPSPQRLRKEGMAMTIVEARARDHRWRRHAPRRPRRSSTRPARPAHRHRVFRCRRRRLRGAPRVARGLRRGHQDRRRRHRLLWRRARRGSCGARASTSSRSTGRTARPGAIRASPTPSTRSRPPGRRSVVGPGDRRKTKDGPVEAIRALVVAKRSARQARVKALVQMRHLGISAPEQLRLPPEGPTVTALVTEAPRLRPGALGRSGDRSHQVLAVLARPSRPVPRRRDSPSSTRRSSHCSPPPRPSCSPSSVSGPTPRRRCSSRPATIPNGSTQRPRGPTCAASRPSRRTRARAPVTSACTTAGTVRPTAPCGAS